MTGLTNYKCIRTLVILGLVFLADPHPSYSRVNSLIGGVGLSFDYDDRTFESGASSDSDYQRLVFKPLLDFKSVSERDSFQLKAAPGIKYDLQNDGTDWDNNASVIAERFINQFWQLKVSDTYLRSDHYREDIDFADAPPEEPPQAVPEASDPQLSTDLGRRRYWKNSLKVASNHFYREDSLVQLGANYISLRNEDSNLTGLEDYDRYLASFINEHRYSPIWKSFFDFTFVVGDFDSDEQLSRDLNEYHLQVGVENDSIVHNPISLEYGYIGTKYVEDLQNDSDIHNVTLSWKHEVSANLYTRLGIGPSYSKIEEQEGDWAGNGIAELNYRVEHGDLNIRLEKLTETENFSGNNEQGLIDSWETELSVRYKLLKDLTTAGHLFYLNEDRDISQQETIHKDRYLASLGFGRNFWRYYTASIDYTFTKQDSDRIEDTYDDHRILLTLSWRKELYHW